MHRTLVLLLAVSLLCSGENGVLVVSVRSAADTPLSGVRIGTQGDGATISTDDSGRGRIRLSAETRPGKTVMLQVVPPPDLAIVSPWSGRTFVPPFENESDNFVPVILVRRADLKGLQNAAVDLAVIARSQSKQEPRHKRAAFQAPEFHGLPLNPVAFEQAREVQTLITEEAADEFGFSRTEVEAALKQWETDDLSWKIVVLTGRVEFGNIDPFSAVIGDIDGSGISFGIGYWNARQGSLQALLKQMRAADAARFDAIMGPDREFVYEWLAEPPARGLVEVREKMLHSRAVAEPWKSRLATLGRIPEFQRVELSSLRPRVKAAQELSTRLGLRSERAVAFLYDTTFSQGSAFTRLFTQDEEKFAGAIGRQPDEKEKLLLLANRASARVPAPFQERLRQRYLAFALGKGSAGGVAIDLSRAGLEMRDAQTGQPVALVNNPQLLQQLESGWLATQ